MFHMLKQHLTRILTTLFVAGNLLGVFPIAGQAGVYRPHESLAWIQSITSQATSHTLSALLFLIGALSGIYLGRHLQEKGRTWAGFSLMLGSGWNAFFIPIPLLLSQLVQQGYDIQGVGTKIALGLAIFGDAMFNGLMGLSIVFLSVSHQRSIQKFAKPLGISGIVVGFLTMGISGQFEYTACADLLKVAGPLWLIWWLVWGWTVDLSTYSSD